MLTSMATPPVGLASQSAGRLVSADGWPSFANVEMQETIIVGRSKFSGQGSDLDDSKVMAGISVVLSGVPSALFAELRDDDRD